MTRAIVTTDRATAEQIAARVDAALGYPREGVPIGSGIHVPRELARTLRHAAPIEHPTRRGEWAYPVDDVSEAKLARVERDAAVTLPEDWKPAEAIAPTREGDADPKGEAVEPAPAETRR